MFLDQPSDTFGILRILNSRNLKIFCFVSALLIVFLIFSSIFIWLVTNKIEKSLSLNNDIEGCVHHSLNIIKEKQVNVEQLGNLSQACYFSLYNQGTLNDFNLRRMQFVQQYFSAYIVLWMVVSITLSGVFLAGLQLYYSFRLSILGRSEFAQSGEVSLEKDKLYLKSAVTGLFILVISLAFFAIFVFEVYRVPDVDVDRGSSARLGSQNTSPAGGLGPPPGN